MGWLSALDPQLRAPLAISFGAVPGALCRYYLTQFCIGWFGPGLPIGTLIINLSGAILMGFFVTFTLERLISSADLRLLVAVGCLGYYTTFSTYALETTTLLRQGNWGIGLGYGLGSLVFGVLGIELGSYLAKRLG
jgi:CrcB protein